MHHPWISVAHRGHTINSSDDGASHNSSLIMSLYSCLNETRPRHGEFFCVHWTRVTHTSVDSSSVRVARVRFDQTTGKNHEIETGKKHPFLRFTGHILGVVDEAVELFFTRFYLMIFTRFASVHHDPHFSALVAAWCIVSRSPMVEFKCGQYRHTS